MQQQKSNEINQKATFVTFNLPLYIKAKDIVHAQGKELPNVIVRFNGFHLLMFYIGLQWIYTDESASGNVKHMHTIL